MNGKKSKEQVPDTQLQVNRGEHLTSTMAPPPFQLTADPSAANAPVVQAKGLGVDVPDITPQLINEIETEHDYQWQNEHLLDTIYDDKDTLGNERLNSLRQFLYIQKELELQQQFPSTSAEISQEDAFAMAEQEKTELAFKITSFEDDITAKKGTIAKNKAEIPTQKALIKQVKKDRKAALKKGSRAKEVDDLRTDAQKMIDKQNGNVNMADKNLAWAEKQYKPKKDQTKYESQTEYWNKVKGTANKKMAPSKQVIIDTQAEYDALIAPFDKKIAAAEARMAELKEENAKLKEEYKAAEKEVKALKGEIKTIEKVAKGNPEALLDWKLNRYQRELKGMDHEALLLKIQALFAQDPDGTRFPEWVRYAVIHMSGMRYDNAHNSWYSSQKLLKTLQDVEMSEASHSENRTMAAQGQQLIDQKGDAKGLGLTKAERESLAKTESEAVSKKLKGDDQLHYQTISGIQDQLTGLYQQLANAGSDPAQAQQIQTQIQQLEADLSTHEGQMSSEGLEKVKKAAAKRQKFLLKIYAKNAKKKIDQLSNKQALAVLQQMKDAGQIPEEVWQELQTFTELRVDSNSSDWEANKHKKGLKDVKGATPEEQAKLDLWKNVLNTGFYGSTTGWRGEHAKSFSPNIVSSIVCDQLGSYMQHLRGHNPGGGLRKNQQYYQDAQKAGKPGAFFKNPKSVADLPMGASLFWIDWSEQHFTDEYKKLYKSQQYLKGKAGTLQKKIDGNTKNIDKKKKNGEDFHYAEWKREKWGKKNSELKEELDATKARIQEIEEDYESMRIYMPEKDKLPDISNIVSPSDSVGDKYKMGDFSVTDGATDKAGWTYKVRQQQIRKSKATTIMRVKRNPYDTKNDPNIPLDFSTSPNPKMVKQWMKWQHQATVMHADANNVVTYDTSTSFDGDKVKGMGAKKRPTGGILNNPKVFVGYSPNAAPDITPDEFLNGYTDNMSPESASFNDNKDK